MSEIERIGLSVDGQLLKEFDDLISQKGYENRSEAFRDMMRDELGKEKLKNPNAKAVAAVFILYDHHNARLSQKLLQMQHTHLLETISSMHVHVTHHDCLEVIILKGKVGQIRKLADSIISLKGVHLGKLNLVDLEK